MSTYPLDFHRRAEQKWAHRTEVSSAYESTSRASRVRRSQDRQHRPSQSEPRDILARSPWLRAIRVWLRAEYCPVQQTVPGRLATRLKQVKGRQKSVVLATADEDSA